MSRSSYVTRLLSVESRDRFPITGAMFASALTIVLIAFTVATTWRGHRGEEQTRARLSAMDDLVWQAITLHDARANAAEMAVLTGDEESVRRYKALAHDSAVLAHRLHDMRDLTPSAAVILERLATLTRLEDSAIAVVESTPHPHNRFFTEHAAEAKNYRAALEMIPRQTAQRRAQLAGERTARTRRLVATLGLATIMLALTWIFVIRSMMRQLGSRRKAEQLYREASRQNRLILEATADGLIGMDHAGKVVFMNPAAARMLGSQDGDSSNDGVALEAIAEARKTLTDGVEGGSAHSKEFDLVRGDGSSIPVEISVAALRGEEGDLLGNVFGIRDITQRRELDRMKREFVATVSHELRTPLTSIRGSLGLITAGLFGRLDDKGQRMLDIALNNTDRLVRLINDILDIERIESGAVAMNRVNCDGAALILTVTDAMRPLAEKNHLRLLASSRPISVFGDSDRLTQVLTNLIGNAIKFSPPGEAIDVSASRNGDHAVFQVRDHGRGIPAEKLESIFKRFEQVDSSDSREKGGTGLGLAISRSIVQQHGGRIWVESTPGEGSVFSFTVPLTVPSAGVATDSASEAVKLRRPRVLVCEDDAETLKVISKMLVTAGYEVAAVQSSEEAIARASECPPDAVLLDIIPPGMSGWQTLAAIRDACGTHEVPIIILSGLVEREAAGIAAWLEKPAAGDELSRALDGALAATLRSRRVVIAEDDVDLGRILVTLFERDGIVASHATSGTAAVDLIEKTDPDLVVLDLALPGLDGFEVFDWMRRRKQWAQTPIMVYSGLDLTSPETSRFQRGPTEMLIKGKITPEDFERRALRLLKAAVGREENEGESHGDPAHPPH